MPQNHRRLFRSAGILPARLGVTGGALKTALHRLRRRFGEILRAEIIETLSDPEDLEDEIRGLLRAFD